MTRAEAEREAKRLADEHQDGQHVWLPREGSDGSWAVAKVRLPQNVRRTPIKATTEAKPKPPQADDPRPAMWRDVGGPYGAS
jgi:hypothetical protein